MWLRTKQSGDTIVEVLLAVAVMGLVLGGAYAIANRSISIGQSAAERTEALKQIETQVERMRTLGAIEGSDLVDFDESSAFCIDQNLGVISFGPSVTIPELNTTEGDNIEYPTSGECNVGPEGRYGISITRSTNYEFLVRARWQSISGSRLDEVLIKYKLYPNGSDFDPSGGGP